MLVLPSDSPSLGDGNNLTSNQVVLNLLVPCKIILRICWRFLHNEFHPNRHLHVQSSQ